MGTLIQNTVPTEKQYFEDYICDDGLEMGPYRIKCAMWREGKKVIFDFEGTDPQSIGSINFYLNEEMFKMFCGVFIYYGIKKRVIDHIIHMTVDVIIHPTCRDS